MEGMDLLFRFVAGFLCHIIFFIIIFEHKKAIIGLVHENQDTVSKLYICLTFCQCFVVIQCGNLVFSSREYKWLNYILMLNHPYARDIAKTGGSHWKGTLT